MKLFKKFNKKGFTLFELLAVMAILAIIAGIAVPRVMATIKSSRIDSVADNMKMVANAARRYVIESQIGNSELVTDTVAVATYTDDTTVDLSDYIESMPDKITLTIREYDAGQANAGDVEILVSYSDADKYQGITADEIDAAGAASDFTVADVGGNDVVTYKVTP